jgi:ABC-type branched-subunit amino acid transport system substrate-binding protein
VKIGQTMAYSGPASSFATVGRAMTAYFHNAEGGVNGRKINLISLDDSYSPPKTVEQTRRLKRFSSAPRRPAPIGRSAPGAIDLQAAA